MQIKKPTNLSVFISTPNQPAGSVGGQKLQPDKRPRDVE
jgi:hypothetical protein